MQKKPTLTLSFFSKEERHFIADAINGLRSGDVQYLIEDVRGSHQMGKTDDMSLFNRKDGKRSDKGDSHAQRI